VYLRSQGRTNLGQAVVAEVVKLALAGLPELVVICPWHVEKDCGGINGGCKLDHPRIDQTTDPWFLLNCSDRPSKYPCLAGIGLQGWIDIASVCPDSVRSKCTYPRCRWRHLPDEKLGALRKAMGHESNPRSMRARELTVKVLLAGSDGNADTRLMPKGFGLTFFADPDLTENVRLVAVIASELNGRRCQLDFAACWPLLLRMCRAAYRFPDMRAVYVVKQVLGALRPEDLRSLSEEVSKEVDGDYHPSARCLLSTTLNRNAKPTELAPRRAGPPPNPRLNPDAKEFVPQQQRQPSHHIQPMEQVNRWAVTGGNAAQALFFRPQVATPQPMQWASSGWAPTLRPVGAPAHR